MIAAWRTLGQARITEFQPHHKRWRSSADPRRASRRLLVLNLNRTTIQSPNNPPRTQSSRIRIGHMSSKDPTTRTAMALDNNHKAGWLPPFLLNTSPSSSRNPLLNRRSCTKVVEISARLNWPLWLICCQEIYQTVFRERNTSTMVFLLSTRKALNILPKEWLSAT